MRMLMSLDTSTTSRFGCCSRSAFTTPRIWLSALPCGRPAGSLTSSSVGLEEQLAAGLACARSWPAAMPSLCGVARRHVGGQRVEVAADLARVARDLGHAALVAVELLERDHRQVDVVLLEAEQRRRVVHQHVGVEHEQLGRAVCRAACASRSVRDARCAGARRRRLRTTAGAARRGAGRSPSYRSSSAGAAGSAAGRAAARVLPVRARPGIRSRSADEQGGFAWQAAWAVAWGVRRLQKQKSRTAAVRLCGCGSRLDGMNRYAHRVPRARAMPRMTRVPASGRSSSAP